mmetsp:Transcript_7955/g.17469  ORF Transcript_7955/g.17469 Transcript_7955/m.17469 type:complete len:158 (+) Transcript_7955:7-480(+)
MRLLMTLSLSAAWSSVGALVGSMPCRIHKAHSACAPRMGLLDDMVSRIRDATHEVTVQHILVPSQMDARQLWKELIEEGVTPESVGLVAASRSACGSGKKRPDAKLAQLRGRPGELRFRRGQMAPEFERIAFEAPVGELQEPFSTQFGWHIVLVNER